MPKQETSDARNRRRGRPLGKNRIPLSLAEKRARNAQYERQRRIEASKAMAELSEAAGCNVHISNTELLATVVAQLERAPQSTATDDIETLRQCNENLMQQIEELEQRLGWRSVIKAEKENLYKPVTEMESYKTHNIRRTIKQEKDVDAYEETGVREQQEFEPLKSRSNTLNTSEDSPCSMKQLVDKDCLRSAEGYLRCYEYCTSNGMLL